MPHTIKDKGCMHNMQPLVGIKYANKCTASEKKGRGALHFKTNTMYRTACGKI